MSEHLGISELSVRTGRSIHALRYYESMGLIPFVIRDSGGRRRYSVQHVEWLLFLDRLKRTGMTLSQMRQYATLVSRGKQTLTERIELLHAHLERIDQQMLELASSRELLIAKIGFYDDWKSTGKRPKSWWVDSQPLAAQPIPKLSKKAG
jgi:DNA-binding transcriptional MerR regulator